MTLSAMLTTMIINMMITMKSIVLVIDFATMKKVYGAMMTTTATTVVDADFSKIEVCIQTHNIYFKTTKNNKKQTQITYISKQQKTKNNKHKLYFNTKHTYIPPPKIGKMPFFTHFNRSIANLYNLKSSPFG